MQEERFDNNKQEEKLVDWENPPTIVDLKADLNEALETHRVHVANVNKWLSALRGDLKIKTMEGRSSIQPKLIKKQNEWKCTSLEDPFLSTDKLFTVNPVTYADVEAARQHELILNKQYRVDIPRVSFINEYIRTAVNTGTVIVKLEWETKMDTVTEEVIEPVYAETEEELMGYLQGLIESGQMTEEDAANALASGELIPIGEQKVIREVVTNYVNRPVLTVKDSRKVIIDPSCNGNIDDARFVIDRYTTDLSSLKESGKYKNLDKISEGSFNPNIDSDFTFASDEGSNFAFKDKPRKKLVVYEYWGYWDINGDGIVKPIVAAWVDNTMIRLAESPYPDKKVPFVVVKYLPTDEKSIYGEPDAALLEDNQSIIGAVTRGIIDLLGRSANAQQGIAKGLLDPVNKDYFKKGLDFEFNPVANLDNAIVTTKMPEIPNSALQLIQLMNNEAESLTGTKAFSSGISGDALGSQVGNARSALDATAKRDLSALRRFAKGLVEVGKKQSAMNTVWLSDEEIIRISDDEFVAIKRDDLAGNFDLNIEIATAEADNQKANDLVFMMQTLGNTVPFDILKIILVKIAELRKLPDLAMAIKKYEPQPDPLAIAKAEAEIEYLRANTQKDITAGAKNVADEVLKYAKAEEAGSKSRKTKSEADLQDLNYLEQMSGLTQDREIERLEVKNKAALLKQQSRDAAKYKSY